MKDFFKTLGKGLVALALIGGLATGGYYLGTAISADKVIEQPDNPGADIDVETKPFLADLTPLGLAETDIVYSNKIDSGYIISSKKRGTGIWYCDEKTNELTQVYTEGYSWAYCQPVVGGCLISSLTNSCPGLLLFKTSTREIVNLKSDYYNWHFLAVDGGVFLSNSDINYLYFYDNATQSIDPTMHYNLSVNYCVPVEGGYLFPHILIENPGIEFYDNSLHSFSGMDYHEGCQWQYFQPVDGGVLISSSSRDLDSQGILFYDNVSHKISKIYGLGHFWNKFHKVDGGYLISSGLSSNKSILFYDEVTKVVTNLGSEMYSDLSVKPVDGGCLISMSHTGAAVVGCGLLFFDENTRELSQLYTGAFKNPSYVEVDDGYVIHNVIDGKSCKLIVLHYVSSTHTVVAIYEGELNVSFSSRQMEDGLIFESSYQTYFLDLKTFEIKSVLNDFE